MKQKLTKLKNIAYVILFLCLVFGPVINARIINDDEFNTIQLKLNSDGTYSQPTSGEEYLGSIGKEERFIPKKNSEGENIMEKSEARKTCTGFVCNLIDTIIDGGFSDTTSVIANPDSGEIIDYEYHPGLTSTVMASTGQLYLSQPIIPASEQLVTAYDNMKNKLSFVETVQAAPEDDSSVYFPGLGWDVLRPIHSFWNMNKNIAYGFMIIVVYIIAMMMLFRQKLNGQNAINLMNALPSLIASLLLISFSYGFSGLFIDVITVGSNLVQSILLSSPGAPGQNIWQGTIQHYENLPFQPYLVPVNKGIGELGAPSSPTSGDLADPMNAKVGLQIDDPLVSVWLLFGTANLDLSPDELEKIDFVPQSTVLEQRSFIGPLVNSVSSVANNLSGDDTVQLLASKLLIMVMVFAAFKAALDVFLKLLKSWLTLVLYPILSPFIFLAAAIPGQTGKMIKSYINTMLPAALSFVAVYAVFMFIIVISNLDLIQGFTFYPPLLGYGGNASLSAGGETLRVLLAYALFLSVPLVPDAVTSMVKNQTGEIFKEGVGNTVNYTTQAAQKLLGLGQSAVGQATGAQGKRMGGQ